MVEKNKQKPFFNPKVLFMKEYTEKLLEELTVRLAELDRQYDSSDICDPRMRLICSTMAQVSEKLKNYEFSADSEEIEFFKQVLPKLFAMHIYYQERVEWDKISSFPSLKQVYHFAERIFSQAEKFRECNQAFYEYCRDGKTELDDLYFLRKSALNRSDRSIANYFIVPDSPPLHCELRARLITYAKLEWELKRSIEGGLEDSVPSRYGKQKLRWTGKKTDIVELGYVLKESGALNNGEATLTEIFEFLGEGFGVNIGNWSSLFQDILRRKGGYTNFLDASIKKFQKRIDEIENGHIN